jgi:glutaredoxin
MPCERVKEFLSLAGVEFVSRNVEEDPDAYDALVASGFRSVPVTMIGTSAVRGFDPAALRAALGLDEPAAT